MDKIQKGDKVVVLSGKNKGEQGTVTRNLDSCYVVVEGVNRVKKHVRPNPLKGVVGGIVEKNMPIHVSNVALLNPVTGKQDRVGFRFLESGKKVRFFKSNGELVG